MIPASEIVKNGFRELNLLSVNEAVVPAQETEALELLNSFLDSLFGVELGEFSMDWPVPPSTTSPTLANFPQAPRDKSLPDNVWPFPRSNVRLLLRLKEDTTIFLPQAPDDGARIQIVNVGEATAFKLTLDANGRLVKGADTTTDTPAILNGTNLLYRADVGDWKVVKTMLAADISPLPQVYDDLLAIGLAIRLGPRFGKAISQESAVRFTQLMKRLKAQYRQFVPSIIDPHQPFLSPASSRHGTSSGGVNGSRLF